MPSIKYPCHPKSRPFHYARSLPIGRIRKGRCRKCATLWGFQVTPDGIEVKPFPENLYRPVRAINFRKPSVYEKRLLRYFSPSTKKPKRFDHILSIVFHAKSPVWFFGDRLWIVSDCAYIHKLWIISPSYRRHIPIETVAYETSQDPDCRFLQFFARRHHFDSCWRCLISEPKPSR